MFRTSIALLAVAALMPAVLLANTTPIPVDLSTPWVHTRTGLPFPTKISGIDRIAIDDFGRDQFDVAGTYRDGRGETFATLYLFRAGLPDASIWHDRILAIVEDGPLGHADRATAKQEPFTPPGAAKPSGYVSTMSVAQGGRIKSTGVAIFPHDRWLISVRMSSKVLSQAQLAARLNAFIAELSPGREKVAAPAAYLIAACSDRLPDIRARRDKPDVAAALVSGSISSATEDETVKPGEDAEPPTRYCRDASSTASYGVYRAGPSSAGYLIAFNDGGVVALVEPDQLGQLIHKRSQIGYSLAFVTNEARSDYAGFRELPGISQVIDAINADSPISSSKRDGNLTIFIPAGK